MTHRDQLRQSDGRKIEGALQAGAEQPGHRGAGNEQQKAQDEGEGLRIVTTEMARQRGGDGVNCGGQQQAPYQRSPEGRVEMRLGGLPILNQGRAEAEVADERWNITTLAPTRNGPGRRGPTLHRAPA